MMPGYTVKRPATAFSLDPSDKSQRRIRDDAHLTWIKSLPSVISGRYGCEAAHIRYGNPSYRKKRTGKGQKPDDAWTVPLTPQEHRDQHSMNERDFWLRHGIDPIDIARHLYEISGNTNRAKKIISQAGVSKS